MYIHFLQCFLELLTVEDKMVVMQSLAYTILRKLRTDESWDGWGCIYYLLHDNRDFFKDDAVFSESYTTMPTYALDILSPIHYSEQPNIVLVPTNILLSY